METHHVNSLFDDGNLNLTGRPELYLKSNRGSHSSDTSSAYSGSGTMTSIHSSSLDQDEVDLSGLVESVVDSDEDDLAESMDSLTVRDTVRECLEKDPSDRTEEDIETLLEFTQKLKAFNNMTLVVRKALCSVMVFAVVETAGTIVMNDGEMLDSWSVLINGSVEVEHINGDVEHLYIGDSFGIRPTMEKLYHHGIMKTKCDDCQFVCITQTDYYKIQNMGEDNIKKIEEDGRVVMVTESRQGADEKIGKKSFVVIRGTVERLMQQLIDDETICDQFYVEDFLLTYRTFINNPIVIAKQFIEWFDKDENCTEFNEANDIYNRVARVVLRWVSNHFTDFETNTEMMDFLESFESRLEQKNMVEQLKLLHLYAQHKARERTVTIGLSSREEDLNFEINGGQGGIFITSVKKNTKPDEAGLKRGDQILSVNGQNFEHVTYTRAMEILRGTTHLSITVKSNLWAFKMMVLNNDGNSGKKKMDILKSSRLSAVDILGPPKALDHVDGNFVQPFVLPSPMKDMTSSTKSSSSQSIKGGFMTLGGKKRIQKALIKMKMLPKKEGENSNSEDLTKSSNSSSDTVNMVNDDEIFDADGDKQDIPAPPDTPDQVVQKTQTIYFEDTRTSDYPEHILNVYKADQSSKYLLVHRETTAHEVVMLALQEFGIHDPSSNFSLCEVSVDKIKDDKGEEREMIKQRRLPDHLQNLAERIGLSSRYYLKRNGITETLVPDTLAPELIRESAVHFLQLNANELAIQLTLQDFSIFRQIESTEYIDDLFDIKSKYGVPMLSKFSELVNREMFWVVTEVCSEHNMVKRSKIIKQFVKIARHCKDCKNFNSMFAIISGLGHASVSRLRMTWEKLPSKYQKLFNDLQDLMDPSRNMSKYRQMVSTEMTGKHPLIPFYPVVKKDLTFIHLGNDTKIDGLINFEKLRMLSKEVRSLMQMCNSQYELKLELKGQPPSSAMLALNQMSVQSTLVQQPINSISTGHQTVKRKKKTQAAPNPKKMFEEAQMVRRVKAYLNHMKVITDEDELHRLSLQCESLSSSAPSSVQIRKRHPSPTLSTTSSTSSKSEGKKGGFGLGMSNLSLGSSNSVNSGVPKFGSASPQAVKKLLSLSEQTKTRPHQPRHPSIPNNLQTANPLFHHPFHTHLPHSSMNISHQSPSPGSHRRIGSSSTTPYVYPAVGVYPSPTNKPPPIVPNLPAESSSVTSLRKPLPSTESLLSDGLSISNDESYYHIASSIIHNTPSPIQQRRHLSLTPTISPHHHFMTEKVSDAVFADKKMQYGSGAGIRMPKLPKECPIPGAEQGSYSASVRGQNRYPPPSYNLAMSRYYRIGRAHSHEGVTSMSSGNLAYYINPDEDDDDAQVSAV